MKMTSYALLSYTSAENIQTKNIFKSSKNAYDIFVLQFLIIYFMIFNIFFLSIFVKIYTQKRPTIEVDFSGVAD